MRYNLPLYTNLNVGFSCGKDSIACAHFLKFKCYKDVTLIHFNNQLDGDEVIAQGCRDFAENYGFKFIEIVAPAEPNEVSCREARMMATQRVGIKELILCHHLGDCVENYLRNVFSGKPDYAPMKMVTNWGECKIVRPFLKERNSNIIRYNEENDLHRWIKDDPISKQSRRYWMRTKLLPVIEENYNLETVVLKMIK